MSINVKISRTKLICALKDKIVAFEQEITELPKKKAQVDIERRKCVISFVKMLKSIPQEQFVDQILAASNWSHVSVPQTCKLPENFLPESAKIVIQDKIKSINNTIKILELSSEETVSTKTYSEVVKYL